MDSGLEINSNSFAYHILGLRHTQNSTFSAKMGYLFSIIENAEVFQTRTPKFAYEESYSSLSLQPAPPPYSNPAFKHISKSRTFDPLRIFQDHKTNAHVVNILAERYMQKFEYLDLNCGDLESVRQKCRQDVGWVRQKFWNEGWGEPDDEVLLWWFEVHKDGQRKLATAR